MVFFTRIMVLSAADQQLAVSADRVIGHHQAKPWSKPRPQPAAGCSSLALQSQFPSFSTLPFSNYYEVWSLQGPGLVPWFCYQAKP